MSIKVTKTTSYYCEDIVDGWIDIRDNGTVEVYGVDHDKYTLEDVRKLALFFQHVYDNNRNVFDEQR